MLFCRNRASKGQGAARACQRQRQGCPGVLRCARGKGRWSLPCSERRKTRQPQRAETRGGRGCCCCCCFRGTPPLRGEWRYWGENNGVGAEWWRASVPAVLAVCSGINLVCSGPGLVLVLVSFLGGLPRQVSWVAFACCAVNLAAIEKKKCQTSKIVSVRELRTLPGD